MTTPTITLTPSQENALKKMKDFIESPSDRCFILTGYAGTGKTTLMRFFINHLDKKQKKFILLSTTGRAAKILANYTRKTANTIHSMIYSYKGLNQDLSDIKEEEENVDSVGQLYINFTPTHINDIEEKKPIIYIIDEASMISDTPNSNITQAKFGSGKLLTELLNYDSRPKSKFIFVGDPCQLPPVEGKISLALDVNYIANTFSCGVKNATLTQVMRQKNGNTIIHAAEKIRQLWQNAPLDASVYGYNNRVWGMLPFSSFPDIHLYRDLNEMIEEHISTIKQHGYNESVFICQSNKLANQISQNVRKQLNFNNILQSGDLLMVQQNQFTTGLMNGDMVEVVSCSPTRTKTIRYKNYKGFRSELFFKEITVRELFTQKIYTTLVIETILTSGNNNLDSYQQTGLFLDFVLRMKAKNITQKKEPEIFYKAMQEDPFLNALRCSYGYAVTCHKAQGGEWNKVFVAFSRRNNFLNPTKEIYQWIYTAITRAKHKVGFINDFYFR